MPFEINTILFLFGLGFGPACLLLFQVRSVTVKLFAAPLLSFVLLTFSGDVVKHFGGNFSQQLFLLGGIELLAYLGLGLQYRRLREVWQETVSRQLGSLGYFLLPLPLCGFLYHNLKDVSNGYYESVLNADIAAYHVAASQFFEVASHPFSVSILETTSRWHVPIYFHNLNALFHAGRPSLEIGFAATYLLIVCCAFFIAALLAHYRGGATPFRTWSLLALGIVANYEGLYFLLSGFVPHAITIFLSTVVFVILLTPKFLEETKGGYILLALLSAAIMGTLSEAWMILFLYLILVIILAWVFGNRPLARQYAFALASIVLGLLVIYPISSRIIPFIFANTANIGNIGYRQPSFPFPTELIGIAPTLSFFKYFDYVNQVQFGVPFKPLYFSLLHACGSLVLAVLVIHRFRDFDKPTQIHLTAVGGVLVAIFAYNLKLLFLTAGGYPPVNYVYAKLASIFSPFLIVLLFLAFNRLRFVFVGVISLQVVSVFLFVQMMNQNELKARLPLSILQVCAQGTMEEYAVTLPVRGQRGRVYISQMRYIDLGLEQFYSVFCPNVTFINQWGGFLSTPKQYDQKIAILIPKDRKLKIVADARPNIIYEDADHILLRTEFFFRNEEIFLDPGLPSTDKQKRRMKLRMQNFINSHFVVD